jgi:hypothetical protein
LGVVLSYTLRAGIIDGTPLSLKLAIAAAAVELQFAERYDANSYGSLIRRCVLTIYVLGRVCTSSA